MGKYINLTLSLKKTTANPTRSQTKQTTSGRIYVQMLLDEGRYYEVQVFSCEI